MGGGALVVAGAVAVAAVSLLGGRTAGSDGAAGPPLALSGHRGSPATRSWTPWPQALHDAQHSGAGTATGPATGHVRWRRRLEGNVTPGPVVAADGTIYAASNAGVLHALDPATGRDLWTVDGHGSYGIDQSTSPAVLPDGLILWPGPDDTLVAVTPAGRVSWRLRLAGQVTSPAVTPSGDVVVGDSSGGLLGLRPTPTGPGVTWRLALDEQTYGSPVLSADGRTTYQLVQSGVVAVRHGRLRWRWRVPSQIVEVSPAVAPDGTVVIGTNDPFEYGLDPHDGHPLWRFRRDFWSYSSPGVTRDGIAYFGDHDNRIRGVDAATGHLLFSFLGTTEHLIGGGAGIWTSILVDAHHTVYAGTRQGLVYAVDRDGNLLWTLRTGSTVDSYPALAGDGALLIGTTGGELLDIAGP